MNRFVSVITVVALFFVSSAQAQQPAKLAWKFTEGQKLDIEMTQTMKISMTIMGQKNDTQTTTKSWMSWETLKVDDEVVHVNSKINRMTVDVANKAIKAKYDTSLPEDDPGQDKRMGAMMKSLVNVDMGQTMQRNGKITSVEVPDALKKIMGKGGGEMVETLSRNSSLEFPADPLKVGDSWKVEFTTPSPVGKMKLVNEYTYAGVKEGNSDLHVIEVTSKMEFIKEEGSPVTITIDRQDTKGKMFFDEKKGRLDSSSIDQDVDMIVETAGQKIAKS